MLAAALLAAGCTPASKMPELHPVTGQVSRGSTPIPQAIVRFASDDTEPAFTYVGVTGVDGKFTISTLEAKTNKKSPGAPAGTYRIVIVLPMDENQRGGGELTLPEPFTVKSGTNVIPAVDVSKF